MWKTFIFMAHIPVYINTFPVNDGLFAEFHPKAALALWLAMKNADKCCLTLKKGAF